MWPLPCNQILHIFGPSNMVSTPSCSTWNAHTWVTFGKIHSKGSLRGSRGFIVETPVLSKFDSLRAIGMMWMQLHSLAMSVVLVISWFVWKTRSKHLDVHTLTLSRMTTLDAIFIQQPSTFLHPGSRVAAVGHYVEVATFEVLLVKTIDIFKLQTSIFEYPVTCYDLSICCVPNEDCKKEIILLCSYTNILFSWKYRLHTEMKVSMWFTLPKARGPRWCK